MSGKQIFIKKKLLPTEVKRHLILNGHAGTRYLITHLTVATWTLRGQVTWASRSSGPTCVQKGRPGILSTTDGRGRPKFGSRWSPNYWAYTYPHKMAAQQWAPGMDGLGCPLLGNQVCPTWVPTSAQSGHPPLPNLGSHVCPTWKPISIHVGSPLLSILGTHSYPRWTVNSVHNGSPCLPTLGVHTTPRWESTSAHVGCPHSSTLGVHACPHWVPKPTQIGSPTLPMSGVHACPCWAATSIHGGCPISTQVESPSPSTEGVHFCPSWKPNPCAWMPKSCRRLEAHP